MKLIATAALQDFQEKPVEEREKILLAYVNHVEQARDRGDDPLYFLEWYLAGKE